MQSSIRLKKTVTRNSLVGDLLDDPLLSPIFREMLRKYSENKVMSALESDGSDMMLEFVRNMPLRVLAAFSQGGFQSKFPADNSSKGAHVSAVQTIK